VVYLRAKLFIQSSSSSVNITMQPRDKDNGNKTGVVLRVLHSKNTASTKYGCFSKVCNYVSVQDLKVLGPSVS
jgi:hypothetical protein